MTFEPCEMVLLHSEVCTCINKPKIFMFLFFFNILSLLRPVFLTVEFFVFNFNSFEAGIDQY